MQTGFSGTLIGWKFGQPFGIEWREHCNGKMRKNQFITVDFRYEFRESQAAFCKHFQYQKSRYGLLKGFSKLLSNFV
jgi:hypothetical protein